MMNGPRVLKPLVGVGLLTLLTALAAVVFLSGASDAGDEPGPAIVGVENACKTVAPPQENSAKVVYGKRPDGKLEMTEWSDDGSYHVTRCTETGALDMRQHVIPVKTPDGLKMLATATQTPTGTMYRTMPNDYGALPALREMWAEGREAMLARTLPPTAESTVTE